MSNKIKEIYHWLKNSNTNLDDALYFYKNIDELPHFKKVWSRQTIFDRYIHAFMILFKRIITFFDIRRVSKPLPENVTTILYVNSNNTFHSIKFLKIKEEIYFLEQSNRIFPYQSQRGSIIHNIKTPFWITLLSFFNFPIYVLFFWKKSVKHPHLYFENWGKDYVNMRLLRNYKNINKVVFANDHNVENRLFKIACETKRIKTIYLQHASVTKLFPRLDFDENYLFGEMDKNKYESIGEITGNVTLIGSSKFDLLYPFRKKTENRKNNKIIGLALNIIDNESEIISLVNEIITKTNYSLIVRLHPGDPRTFSFNSERVSLHKASDKDLMSFLSQIDFLIAGESSIHIESLYINVPSYYVNLTIEEAKDYYGFLKERLVKKFDKEIISDEYMEGLIIGDSNSKNVLKKFIYSVGESFDGNVANELQSKILA